MKTIDPTPINESTEEVGASIEDHADLLEEASTAADSPTRSPANSASPSATPGPVAAGPSQAPRRWWKGLVRLLVALVVAGAVAAGVVLGWPILNDRLLQPVEANSQDTAAIQTELEAALDRVDALETEVGQLTTSISTLNANRDTDIATITEQLDAADGRIDDVDTQLNALTESQDNADAAGLDLAVRLSEVKAMELLSRARLFLYQANYGLAAQDVASAQAILVDVEGDEPARTLAIERLGVVLRALPDRPVAASADLDIAWSALLGEVPAVAISPTAVPGTPTTTTIPGATSVPEVTTTLP